MIILKTMPSAEEFYKTYWGQRPFCVRGAVPVLDFNTYIDIDTLAELATEDDIKSRLIKTQTTGHDKNWQCDHGPFQEGLLSSLGAENWNLLVQNVENYHLETGGILKHFDFAPQWLLDDIMVSASTPRGSVGPHTDSYHVFLVQGIGTRVWTVADAPLKNPHTIDNPDIKILRDPVNGKPVTVTKGDVIYIPPHFAHEGITTQTAMTFSVGFLGPKPSDLFTEYGYYLAEKAQDNKAYEATEMTEDGQGYALPVHSINALRKAMVESLNTDDFATWLAEYFSTPSDIDIVYPRETPLPKDALKNRLEKGEVLFKPRHIKIVTTAIEDTSLILSIFGEVIPTTLDNTHLIELLKTHAEISYKDLNQESDMTLVTRLYNENILFFNGEDISL